jgi:hypothetical protein
MESAKTSNPNSIGPLTILPNGNPGDTTNKHSYVIENFQIRASTDDYFIKEIIARPALQNY